VGRETHWEQAIRLHLTELLLQLSRALPSQENAPTPHAATLREVRLKVHNRVQHPWTVREMCELAGLRETQFSRLYQQLFDCSPMEDLIRARLETAQFYLTNSTLNISAVAEVSGFFNPYYFSRYFRQRTGLAPQEYRRKYRL
jgi:transcriptional regulator GlxA family with amidase domain